MASRADTASYVTAGAGKVNPADSVITLERFERAADIEREWRELETGGVTTVFQRYEWVDANIAHVLPHVNARPAIVLGRLNGDAAFILPLQIVKRGPVRMATWIGGDHAGYNFGLWSRQGAAAMAQLQGAQIKAMLGQVLTDVDCAFLQRTPKSHNGLAQPLTGLQACPSSTEGYCFDLADDFATILARTGGSRRRKNIRRQERKMRKAAGELACEILCDHERARLALDFFFEHKGRHLAMQGKTDGFTEPGVRAFFYELLERSIGMEEPLLQMAGLFAGGKLRAVKGTAIHRGRANILFSAYANDELAAFGPGSTLLYKHIQQCCERGLSVYDLGIGYEKYKESWCDIIQELDDLYASFTPLGAAMVAALRFCEKLKGRMRRNPALWRGVKQAKAYISRRASSQVV